MTVTIHAKQRSRSPVRTLAALLCAAVSLGSPAATFAADAVVLRVGDQKGGNRSLLEISGLANDLPYQIEWSEFPAAAPILEALNAGALDVGYTGDKAQATTPITIDDNVVKEVQEASDRATRHGILSRQVDVGKAVDRSFTTTVNSN
jgi:ABC-type taurine transport system substrate-binding protein